MEHHVDVNAAPEGNFVRDKQGRFYFLRDEQAKRYTVSAKDEAAVEKLWTGSSPKPKDPGAPQPEYSCEALWNWLMHHDIDENWRKVSLMWIMQC